MFKNMKIIFKMVSPIATIHPIQLDGLLSAACIKELLGDDYRNGSNKCATKEMIDEMFAPILDKKYGVYCTSWGFGEHREFIELVKAMDSKNDDIVEFKGKGKRRVDIGCGT